MPLKAAACSSLSTRAPRDDIEPTACTLSQLVFKRSADTNEDDDEGSEAEASTAS